MPELPLSEPSETWLRRMRSACCDESVDQVAFAELHGAFVEFLDTLPAEESRELDRRLRSELLRQ